MSVIKSSINTRSEEFKANAAAMRALVDDLREKTAQAAHGGSEEARQKHLARGKLLARDRVNVLLDPGAPFLEFSPLAGWDMFNNEVAAGGVVFIGPPVAAIRAMGHKSESKKLIEKAGVPLTPGYHGDEQGVDFLRKQADAIGYPVLIKASAGGGGKGMRAVWKGEEFADALASCQREA